MERNGVVDEDTQYSNAASIRAILEILSHYCTIPRTNMEAFSEPVGSPKPDGSENASKLSLSTVVKSIQEQVALLTLFTDEGVDVKQEKEAACASCIEHVKYDDELNLQIDSLRHRWMEDRSKHVQTSHDLQKMQHVVDACNVAFRKLRHSKDGFLGNGLPLSQIATDTIATYCDEQRMHHWDETRAAMERKSAKMKKKARDMVKADQIFYDYASRYNTELFRFGEWVRLRHCWVQENHQQYCQIMQENGAKPELLYEDQEALWEAETSYTKAWIARMDAARNATETAHLYGLSDPFEDMKET